MKTAELTTITRISEDELVLGWRIEQLRSAGYRFRAARELAARREVDLHLAVQLLPSPSLREAECSALPLLQRKRQSSLWRTCRRERYCLIRQQSALLASATSLWKRVCACEPRQQRGKTRLNDDSAPYFAPRRLNVRVGSACRDLAEGRCDRVRASPLRLAGVSRSATKPVGSRRCPIDTRPLLTGVIRQLRHYANGAAEPGSRAGLNEVRSTPEPLIVAPP